MDEAFAASVEAIEWFDECEEDWTGELLIPSAGIPTLVEAGDLHDDPAWERVTHAAAQRLKNYIAFNCTREYQNWRSLSEAIQERLTRPLAEEVWRPFAEWYGFDNIFVRGVQWNVLHAALEHEYRECPGRPEFFTHLLEVYRVGHFPCGWEGKWPAGRLLVW